MIRSEQVALGDRSVPIPLHASLFYGGADDAGVLLDFIRPALAQPREALILFGPRGVPARLRRTLEADAGRPIDPELAAGRVLLLEGDRDPDTHVAKLVGGISALLERGAELVRVLGDVGWDEPGWPLPEDLLWAESRFNEVLGDLPTATVCAYDVTSLPGPALIHGGLETHGLVSVGGRLTSNARTLLPETFVAERLIRLPWLSRTEARPGLQAERGVHACAFFLSRDEEYSTLAPIIQEGVDANEQTVCIIDPARRVDHLERLESAGVPVRRLEASGRLEVRDWHGTDLVDGRFDPDRMLDLLNGTLSRHSEGTRLIADMAWALGRAPGVDALVEYEARLNDSGPPPGDTVICTYDSARVAGATMLDILRAHPYVILGGTLQDNGLFVPASVLIRELRQRL